VFYPPGWRASDRDWESWFPRLRCKSLYSVFASFFVRERAYFLIRVGFGIFKVFCSGIKWENIISTCFGSFLHRMAMNENYIKTITVEVGIVTDLLSVF
jgi:hypothetical protein